jgi:hypothetical protein
MQGPEFIRGFGAAEAGREKILSACSTSTGGLVARGGVSASAAQRFFLCSWKVAGTNSGSPWMRRSKLRKS